jgi:3-oxoacyl-[acyl-carrier protein] reductase
MTKPDGVLSLADRAALITGGASGMGRAAALLFAAHGAEVTIADRNKDLADEVAAEIIGNGGKADSYAVELGDIGSVDRFLSTFLAEHDALDVLYNHAGIPGPPGMDVDYARWNECMTVNVWAPMVTTNRLVPLLRRSASPSIIVTSSIAGLIAVPGLPTYAASKAAVIQFVKSAAMLYAPEGIRVNAVCPGTSDTPALHRDLGDGTVVGSLDRMTANIPMRRLGQPDDMANVALFLASDASKYITGTAIAVDGGASQWTAAIPADVGSAG